MLTPLIFGKFTVRIGLRTDNPAFPCYMVYVGARLIGKSFSMPDEGCCRWLELQRSDAIRYAEESARLRRHTLRGLAKARAISAAHRRKALADA